MTARQGDALSHALGVAVPPILFALLGSWLDGRYGTGHLLLVTLAVFGFVGAIVAASYGYLARCAREEAGKPWATEGRKAL